MTLRSRRGSIRIYKPITVENLAEKLGKSSKPKVRGNRWKNEEQSKFRPETGPIINSRGA